MLGLTATALYGFTSGFLYVQRGKIFGDEWATKNKGALALQDEHKKAFPDSKFSASGYPDMGMGRYSDSLSYAEWYSFANMQRAHYKVVEDLPANIVLQTLASVYFPKSAAALALVWIAGRHTLSSNYKTNGPEARYGGIAGTHMLVSVAWLAMAVAGGLKLSGLVSTTWF